MCACGSECVRAACCRVRCVYGGSIYLYPLPFMHWLLARRTLCARQRVWVHMPSVVHVTPDHHTTFSLFISHRGRLPAPSPALSPVEDEVVFVRD